MIPRHSNVNSDLKKLKYTNQCYLMLGRMCSCCDFQLSVEGLPNFDKMDEADKIVAEYYYAGPPKYIVN